MLSYKNKILRLLNKVILQSKDKYLMFMHKKKKKLFAQQDSLFKAKILWLLTHLHSSHKYLSVSYMPGIVQGTDENINALMKTEETKRGNKIPEPTYKVVHFKKKQYLGTN